MFLRSASLSNNDVGFRHFLGSEVALRRAFSEFEAVRRERALGLRLVLEFVFLLHNFLYLFLRALRVELFDEELVARPVVVLVFEGDDAPRVYDSLDHLLVLAVDAHGLLLFEGQVQALDSAHGPVAHLRPHSHDRVLLIPCFGVEDGAVHARGV